MILADTGKDDKGTGTVTLAPMLTSRITVTDNDRSVTAAEKTKLDGDTLRQAPMVKVTSPIRRSNG